MRKRRLSASSSKSSGDRSILDDQELVSLYDYLAKLILLGSSGCGKSCILHRFVKGRVLGSQTIGVEFSSKLVRVGEGQSRRNMKLQLWDTAGQERYRSLTRGYYRGTAGVLLTYDTTNRKSFETLGEFLADIRALTAPSTSVVVFGNKEDLANSDILEDATQLVSKQEAADFCMRNGGIPLIIGSAKTGHNVEEAFIKLASMIVTKVELGTIELNDLESGVQYGEVPRWDLTVRKRRGFHLFSDPSEPGNRSTGWCCT